MQAGGRRFDPVILHHLCAIARVGDKVVEEAARSWKKRFNIRYNTRFRDSTSKRCKSRDCSASILVLANDEREGVRREDLRALFELTAVL